MSSESSARSTVIEGSFRRSRDSKRRGLPWLLLLLFCGVALILALASQQALLVAPALFFTLLAVGAWRLSARRRILRLVMRDRSLSITGHGYDIQLQAPFRYQTGYQRIQRQGKADEKCFVRMVIDAGGKPLVLEEQVLPGRMPPKLDEILGLSSALGIAELSSCSPFPGTLWAVMQALESLSRNHDTEELDANIATLFKLGEGQMKQRVYSQAIDTFSSIIRHSPESAFAYYNRGAARYFHHSELDKALNDLETALRLEPGQYKCFRMLALIHCQLGEWDAMRDNCTKALQLYPKSAELHNLRGSACFRLQDYDAALDNFDHAIGLDGDRYEAYYNRGLARQRLNMLEEALDDFQQAHKLYPAFEAAQRSARDLSRQLSQLRARKLAKPSPSPAMPAVSPHLDAHARDAMEEPAATALDLR